MGRSSILSDAPAVSTPTERSRGATVLDRWALGLLQRPLAREGIRLALWDGTTEGIVAQPESGEIVFNTRAAFWRVLLDPELQFGEAYMTGGLDIRGDLVTLVEAIYRGIGSASRWHRPHPFLARNNTIGISRDNVHHHYDLGNDFYKLWLDDQLLYTCAYFPTRDVTLEAAQIAKMDLVCRKLRLSSGERIVEAGCGWGAFALHAARRYGARVRAFNLSHEQIAFARARARAEGLGGQVEFVEDDYRNVTGRYDAFVSIGMLEHVGRDHYHELGRTIDRTLDLHHGRGLLHFIGRTRPTPLNAWIRRRIFPGAYPPTIPETTEGVLQPFDLTVLDVENLRLHYALTLNHWLQRFERAAETVARMFDERFVRAWRLYLAGSQAAFTTGWLQLFQVVFAPPRSNAIPWTRPC